MIVTCYDLSSKCIGVTFAQLDKQKIKYIKTLPIIPKRPSAKELGFTTQEPKKVDHNGMTFKSLLNKNEDFTSKKEATRRLSMYKNFVHQQLLWDIGKQCGYYLQHIKPDAIALEKNKAFNGILTTKLLAEITGGLYFYAGASAIDLYDYDESVIRSRIRRSITEFTREKDDTGKIALDTKWEMYARLRSYFERHCPGMLDFKKMTLDESDSLAVFYHWYQKEIMRSELHE